MISYSGTSIMMKLLIWFLLITKKRLILFGITPKELSLFENYRKDRCQFVHLNGKDSTYKTIESTGIHLGATPVSSDYQQSTKSCC